MSGSAEDSDPEFSEIVDNAKKVTDIGPLKALLTPASEVLGQKLRDSVEGWFEKKASSNLLHHAQAVESRTEIEDLSDQSQMDLFGWAAQAGKIAPSEAELSAAVQASLEATINEDRSDSALLLELSREEILFLVGQRTGLDTSFVISSLKSKGLLRTESILEALLRKLRVPETFIEQFGTVRWTAAFGFAIAAILLPTGLITLPMSIALATALEAPADEAVNFLRGISQSLVNMMMYMAALSLVGFLAFVPTRSALTSRGKHLAKVIAAYLPEF